MSITIYRAGDLHNHPAREAKSARKGLLNVGKTFFYDVIEPQLERVQLSTKACGYTAESVERFVQRGIIDATAERAAARNPRPPSNISKSHPARQWPPT